MPRQSPASSVLRALFAKSGNRCAFPGCTAVLINEKNDLIAEVCHIEAAEPKGERFNPSQSDQERRNYSNLLLLCHAHHVETDNIKDYPVDRLRRIKVEHEKTFGQNQYKIDESLLYKLSFEMDEYWSHVELLHRTKHVAPNLAIPVNVRATYMQLADSAEEHLNRLATWRDTLAQSDRSSYDDLLTLLGELGVPSSSLDAHYVTLRRFQRRNSDMVNRALPNHLSRLRALLVQMELQYLEAYLKLNAADNEARSRLQSRKGYLERIATKHGLSD